MSAGGKHLLRQGTELRGPAAAPASSLRGGSGAAQGEAVLSRPPPPPHKDPGVGSPWALQHGVRGAAGGGAGRAPPAQPSPARGCRGSPRPPPLPSRPAPLPAGPRWLAGGRGLRRRGAGGTSPTPSIFNHYLNPRGNEQTSRLGALGIFSAVGRIYPERLFHNKLFLG